MFEIKHTSMRNETIVLCFSVNDTCRSQIMDLVIFVEAGSDRYQITLIENVTQSFCILCRYVLIC